MKHKGMLCTLGLLLAATTGTANAADQTWEVKGKIQFFDTMTRDDGKNINKPLAGCTVEIHGANVGRIYDSWGKVFTDSAGNFSIRKSKSKSKRHFKVRVRFEDRDNMLSVNTPLLGGGLASDWYQVFETDNTTDGPTVNIGTKTFTSSAKGDLGVSDNIKRAHMFYWVKTVMDALKNKGGGIQFTKAVNVAYPANVISGQSYANGVTRTVYIHRNSKSDHGNVDTVLHEVMHLWNYQHNTGTSNWLQAVMSGKSTHEFQEKAAIAFHEGFAEWAMGALMSEFFGRGPVLPSNRFSLARNGLNSFETLERSDDGVVQGLHLLITPQIWAYKFGTSAKQISTTETGHESFTAAAKGSQPPGMPAVPSVTLFDVLKVFLAGQHSNWPTAWQVGTADNGLNVFFKRASDILPNLDSTHRAMMVEMLTASLTKEPKDFLPNATSSTSR